MSRDYFTRAEFDAAFPAHGYTGAQVDAAQAEVIEALEKWAHSAWPNVTGTDGDGTAANKRTATDTFDGGEDTFTLSHVPVDSITSVTVDETALTTDAYYLYAEEAQVVGATELGLYPRGVVVVYRYGYGLTPWSIKRTAMQATKALLEEQKGAKAGSKIPPRTSQYSTEGTTFVFGDNDKPVMPWPWDENASRDVRAYWESEKPIMVGAI